MRLVRNSFGVLSCHGKAQLVNAMVAIQLANKENVTINRNDNFYSHDGLINSKLFDEDKIHVSGDGINRLAGNARFAIARTLGQALAPPSRKKFGKRNFRKI